MDPILTDLPDLASVPLGAMDPAVVAAAVDRVLPAAPEVTVVRTPAFSSAI